MNIYRAQYNKMGNSNNRGSGSNGLYKLLSNNIKSIRYRTKSGITNEIFFAAPLNELAEGNLVITAMDNDVDYLFVHSVDMQKNNAANGQKLTVVIDLVKRAGQTPNEYILLEIEDGYLQKLEHNDYVASQIISVFY